MLVLFTLYAFNFLEKFVAGSMYPAINHDRERLRICLLNIPGHKDIGYTLFRATSVPSMNDTNGRRRRPDPGLHNFLDDCS